jgi:integrase
MDYTIGRTWGRGDDVEPISVDGLCDKYAAHCVVYYRGADGKPTSEVACERLALKSLREMYGERMIGDLRHRDIVAWRSRLEHSGICRKTANERLLTFRRMMRWALDEDLVSALDVAELTQVQPLKRNRSAAREYAPIMPADDAAIAATLPELPPSTADMVRVHRLTGMRPGELCALRWSDVDTSVTPWVYRPEHHKNEWRGHPRVVCIGPKAREVLSRHKSATPDAPIFSPLVAEAERFAAMRAAAHAPSRYDRRNADPAKRRKLNTRWDVCAYTRSIRKACRRAGIAPWAANRLRHSFATEVRRAFGLSACRAVLGHSDGESSITDRYSFAALEDETIRAASVAVEALG